MDSLDALRHRIATTNDLKMIVRTMKALSAVSIRQYDHAATAVRAYDEALTLGVQGLLRHGARPIMPRARSDARAAIVFGTDHGLCGRFNEQVAAYALAEEKTRGKGQPAARYAVAGLRASEHLRAAGVAVDHVVALPSAVSGLTGLGHAVVRIVDFWRKAGAAEVVTLYYNRRSARGAAEPIASRLLPLDQRWLANIAARRWPSRAIPMLAMDADALLGSLVRQHLFVRLFCAAAESSAAEHATRLAAMQVAEQNIGDHLDAMNGTYRHMRQEAITGELLDVIGGFEALRGRRKALERPSRAAAPR